MCRMHWRASWRRIPQNQRKKSMYGALVAKKSESDRGERGKGLEMMINRRTFLKRAAMVSGMFGVLPYLSFSQAEAQTRYTGECIDVHEHYILPSR